MTYVHTDTLKLLVKRYVPFHSKNCLISASATQVMGIVTVIGSMCFSELKPLLVCVIWPDKSFTIYSVSTLRRDTLSARTSENQIHIEIYIDQAPDLSHGCPRID